MDTWSQVAFFVLQPLRVAVSAGFRAPRHSGDRVPADFALARSHSRRLAPPAAPWCKSMIYRLLTSLKAFMRYPKRRD